VSASISIVGLLLIGAVVVAVAIVVGFFVFRPKD